MNQPAAVIPRRVLTWGIDCIRTDVPYLQAPHTLVPIPAIWPYVTGKPGSGIEWTPLQIDYFAARGSRVYRVNQAYDSLGPMDGDEFDVEALAWSVGQCGDVVSERRTREWSTRFYATWSIYGQIKQELADRGIGQSVFFRIADWNLSQHLAELELHDDVYAGQFASPTTNPLTLIPGTGITLQSVGADLNVLLWANTGWVG